DPGAIDRAVIGDELILDLHLLPRTPAHGFDKCRGRAPRGARPTSLGADASPGVRRAASWHALRCGVPHQRRLGALPPSLRGHRMKAKPARKGRKRPAGTAKLAV